MRIILCDDDTAFTQVFEKRLLTVFKKYGITPEIVSAHTGVEALREITRRPTDVLFLDAVSDLSYRVRPHIFR